MRKLSFYGDSNIGYLSVLTNDFIIIGKDTKMPKNFSKHAGVKDVLKTRILGTNLVGLFLFKNNKEWLVSDQIFDWEIDELKNFGLKVKTLKTRNTALANNFLKTNKHLYSNPEIEKRIIDGFKMEALQTTTTNLVGGIGFKKNNNLLLSMDLSDNEISSFQKNNNERIGIGSVNRGGLNLRSGFLVNDNEIFVGGQTTGPEMLRIEEVFKD